MKIPNIETIRRNLIRMRVEIPSDLIGVEDVTDLLDLLLESKNITVFQKRQLITEGLDLFIGPFLVLEKIGEGGSADVFLAVDTDGAKRAIKRSHAKLSTYKIEEEEFYKACAELQKISVINCLPAIHDYGIQFGHAYIAMDFIDGVPLSMFIEENPALSLPEKVRLFSNIVIAVGKLHELKAYHQDLKPQNIIVTEEVDQESNDRKLIVFIVDVRSPWLRKNVLDEGISTVVGTTEQANVRREFTMAYAAPEKLANPGSPGDIVTDIYSLGCVFHKILTGQHPFVGSRKHLMEQIRSKYPNTNRFDLPSDLCEIIRRCVSKSPRHRYGSTSKLLADVNATLVSKRIKPLGLIERSQRVGDWIARNKRVLTSVLVASVLALISLFAIYWYQQFRLENWKNVEINEREYLLKTNFAYSSWLNNDLVTTREMLKSVNGEKRWEWHFIDRLSQIPSNKINASDTMAACAVVGPESRSVLIGDGNGTVARWDLASRRQVYRVDLNDELVKCISISPDGKLVAAGCFDGRVVILDFDTGRIIKTLAGHNFPVPLVKFDPNGRFLVSIGLNYYAPLTSRQEIFIWSATDFSLKKKVDGTKSVMPVCDFSPDNTSLYFAHKRVEFSDFRVSDWTKPLSETITDMKFVDGNGVLISTVSGRVLEYDYVDGSLRYQSIRHESGVNHLSISTEANVFATASSDRSIRVFDRTKRRVTHVLRGHEMEVEWVEFISDTNGLVSCDRAGKLLIWDLEQDTESVSLFNNSRINRLGLNGERVAVAGQDGVLTILDLKQKDKRKQVRAHVGAITDVQFINDSKLLTCGYDGFVKLWNLSKMELIAEAKAHEAHVNCLSLAEDTNILLSGDEKGVVVRWTGIKDGELVRSKEHDFKSAVKSCRFSPSSKNFGLTTVEGEIIVCDLEFKKRFSVFEKSAFSFDVAFLKAGTKIVSAGGDNTIRIWDIGSQTLESELFGHTGMIWRLKVIDEGKRLASSAADNKLIIWDLKHKFPAISIKSDSQVADFCFDQENKHIIYGTRRGGLKLLRGNSEVAKRNPTEN